MDVLPEVYRLDGWGRKYMELAEGLQEKRAGVWQFL
jgi:hypothetical protein